MSVVPYINVMLGIVFFAGAVVGIITLCGFVARYAPGKENH